MRGGIVINGNRNNTIGILGPRYSSFILQNYLSILFLIIKYYYKCANISLDESLTLSFVLSSRQFKNVTHHMKNIPFCMCIYIFHGWDLILSRHKIYRASPINYSTFIKKKGATKCRKKLQYFCHKFYLKK